jgi:hypothetical protein
MESVIGFDNDTHIWPVFIYCHAVSCPSQPPTLVGVQDASKR